MQPTSAPGGLPFRLLCLLAFLLMGATAMNSQPTVPITQYNLSNGLHVILQQDRNVPVAAVMMMYHVGSKNEKPGRTGFAHLFEHIMFKGSEHIADGEHFKILQEIGANINGSTTEDRTNYFEVVPANYVELALYMESDRMGFLLSALTQGKLDNQRDVVKNERRQNYDNQPYGTAYEKLSKALYPPTHPYSWPVIGYMDDLSAATLNDVKDFFTTYYAPNNACVAVVGNFDEAQVRSWIDKYFGSFAAKPAPQRPAEQKTVLEADKRLVAEDNVQLPRLYMYWHSFKGLTREDAVLDVLTDILASGKNSRLYKSLVYQKQIAQSVAAYQDGSEIAGVLGVQITPKPGHTLKEMEMAVKEVLKELLDKGVTAHEIATSYNNKETQLVNRLATVLGKANGLATAYTLWGDAEAFNRDFARYENITPDEVRALATKVLGAHNVVLSIVPNGKLDLAADPRKEAQK